MQYDIIYIGGGLNYAGAIVAAKNGKKVALIESDISQLGGVCLHKGCIPSKMFLHYAMGVFESQNEIFEGEIKLNMQTLFEKKRSLLSSVTKVVTKQCSHFDLIEGKGYLVAPHQVKVNETLYEGENIVIGTGSSSFIPEGIVHDGKNIITSDDVLMLQELPKDIAIYGDGAIALEMASFFATAGVKDVKLLFRHDTIQKKTHPNVQKILTDQLEKIGVTLLPQHSIIDAKSTSEGVTINLEGTDTLTVSKLLVATGRHPNTDVIECDAIKVSKGIDTDAFFETSLKNHYAIGDCNAKLQLAHAARAQALNVTDKILGKDPRALNLDNVVKFIHTLPMSYAQVGRVKYDLEIEGIEYKESIVTLNQFTYSVYNHASKGIMISYVDNDGFILGAEIVAPNAEELIATVAMALAGEMDATTAKRTVLAHPTFSEALERTFFKL